MYDVTLHLSYVMMPGRMRCLQVRGPDKGRLYCNIYQHTATNESNYNVTSRYSFKQGGPKQRGKQSKVHELHKHNIHTFNFNGCDKQDQTNLGNRWSCITNPSHCMKLSIVK